jgi:hypothetical protein
VLANAREAAALNNFDAAGPASAAIDGVSTDGVSGVYVGGVCVGGRRRYD